VIVRFGAGSSAMEDEVFQLGFVKFVKTIQIVYITSDIQSQQEL
jgi:hypothetical protein